MPALYSRCVTEERPPRAPQGPGVIWGLALTIHWVYRKEIREFLHSCACGLSFLTGVRFPRDGREDSLAWNLILPLRVTKSGAEQGKPEHP